MPPALGLFSVTTGWPSDSANFCATVRAVMSAAPPAALGTTILRALLGKVDVCAIDVPAKHSVRPNAHARESWLR